MWFGWSMSVWEAIFFCVTSAAAVLGAFGLIAAFSSAIIGYKIADVVTREAAIKIAETNLETERLKKSLAWRELCPSQLATLEAAIRGQVRSVQVNNIMSDPESLNLCLQLEGAFRAAGLLIVDGAAVMAVKTAPSGIFLSGRLEETQAMKSALASVGLDSSVTTIDLPLSILVASRPRPQL